MIPAPRPPTCTITSFMLRVEKQSLAGRASVKWPPAAFHPISATGAPSNTGPRVGPSGYVSRPRADDGEGAIREESATCQFPRSTPALSRA